MCAFFICKKASSIVQTLTAPVDLACSSDENEETSEKNDMPTQSEVSSQSQYDQPVPDVEKSI